MTPIQKIRTPHRVPTEESNRIWNGGEHFLYTITVNPDHPTCTIESKYVLFEGCIFEFAERRLFKIETSKLDSASKEGLETYFEKNYASSAEAENRIRDTYNRRGGEDEIRRIKVYADTDENVLRYFFVKDKSLTYSNGSSVKLTDPTKREAFRQYFFGDKEGIGRYAELGGNMD